MTSRIFGTASSTAASPSMMSESSPVKSEERCPPSTGVSMMSACFNCISFDSCIMIPIIWSAVCHGTWRSSSERRPLVVLTAITTSQPIAFATSTARFDTSPPSSSRSEPLSTGLKRSGTVVEARIASDKGPSCSTTRCPEMRSVVTTRRGILSSSKLGFG